MDILFGAVVGLIVLWVMGVFNSSDDDGPELYSKEWFDKQKKWEKENKNKPKYVQKSLIDKITEKSEENSLSGGIALLIWYVGVIIAICIAFWVLSMILSGPLEM